MLTAKKQRREHEIPYSWGDEYTCGRVGIYRDIYIEREDDLPINMSPWTACNMYVCSVQCAYSSSVPTICCMAKTYWDETSPIWPPIDKLRAEEKKPTAARIAIPMLISSFCIIMDLYNYKRIASSLINEGMREPEFPARSSLFDQLYCIARDYNIQQRLAFVAECVHSLAFARAEIKYIYI